jgi:hypothetical protein
MDRRHLDSAIEHYAYWRALGLDHWDMLAAIGVGINVPGGANGWPTATDVVATLAAMSCALLKQQLEGETCFDAA